jgi:signal transduction histidine kinase
MRTPFSRPTLPRPRAKLIYFVPFVVIAVLLALMGALLAHRVSELRAATEDVVEDALTDVVLMGKMRRDLDKVRLLTDEHVYERSVEGMMALDARIAAAQADFDAAAAQFDSLPLLPDERGPWQELRALRADIKPRLAHVLTLSRANEDEAARRELVAMDDTFTRATNDLRALSDLNEHNAKDAVPRVGALERSSELYLSLLATAGVALATMAGLGVTRILQERERSTRLYAERLEASNKDLDAFAGRVAHDLRAPLTTATLTTNGLSRCSPELEQQKKLEVLKRSFVRMDGIIQDLLALARITADQPPALCDPAAATEQLRDELASRADLGKVSLTIDVQAATVQCSEGLFRQVIWNLADNAIKYRRTDVSSHVEIFGRPHEQTYGLSVRDNGIGIPPEEAEKVFDPFFRAAGGRREPGTGLGLSIVKRAVEANGGKVSVTSEPGSGSEFVARLRLG